MKNITVIFLFLLIAVCVSCEKKHYSKELEANFSSSEIRELEEIVLFFQGQICDSKENDFEDCLLSFIEEKEDNLIVALIDVELLKELFANLSKSTTCKIWKNTHYTIAPDTIMQERIQLNSFGEFHKYIQSISKSNAFINDYVDFCDKTGRIPTETNLIQKIFENVDEMNFNDSNFQTLISIHFITEKALSIGYVPYCAQQRI